MNVTDITPVGKPTREELYNYIAECSSVVRDKQPKSAEKLFNRLLTESIGDKASRVLEFIPCIVTAEDSYNLGLQQQYFGMFDTDTSDYYTNARELLNWGIDLHKVLAMVDFTNYKIFKCEAPYLIYGQISTHTQLTTVSHSQRYGVCDRGYWKPKEVTDISQKDWDNGVGHDWSKRTIIDTMKEAGVTRKEVWDRGSDMLQNRVFTIGGYTNNPNAWKHFIAQRSDLHTQLETREFVELLKGYMND